jgi:hypothetical protein
MKRLFLCAICLGASATLFGAQQQTQQQAGAGERGRSGQAPNRPTPPPDVTRANATGDAAAVFVLEDKIEAATVSGDTPFADSVLTPDFVMVHGDGWTRGLPVLAHDDKAGYLKRVTDKEYKVHDVVAPNEKIEMHGDVAITYGNYISLFMPANRGTGGNAGRSGARAGAASAGAAPAGARGGNGAPNVPHLASIWYERVWVKRNGRWMYLSHRTVHGPTTAPAGIDPTIITPETQASAVPGLPLADAAPKTYKPDSPEAQEVYDVDQKIDEIILSGDREYWDSHTPSDFRMTHSDLWTRGGRPLLTDTKESFGNRVSTKQYLSLHPDSVQVEMHGDVALTFGRYVATLAGSAARNPDKAWFSVWFERVFQKRDGKWMFLSYRTVHGATYGPSRESVSNR